MNITLASRTAAVTAPPVADDFYEPICKTNPIAWQYSHFSPPQCESALSTQCEQPAPDIFTAAGRGDLSSLCAHLEAEPGLANAIDPSGGTPLHFAVSADQFEAIEMLLASGANPDARGCVMGESPLTLALLFGSLEIARLLLSYGANSASCA